MMYHIMEEASGAIVENCDNLNEIIEDAKQLGGKHLVIDDDDNVLFDTMPNVSYKFESRRTEYEERCKQFFLLHVESLERGRVQDCLRR